MLTLLLRSSLKSAFLRITSLALVAFLAACSGGSGQETTSSDIVVVDDIDDGFVYTGPDAINEDVLRFQQSLFLTVTPDNRCAGCHTPDAPSPVEPYFARSDDVNVAYETISPLVNLGEPGASRIVEKVVTEAHNCFAADLIQCEGILTRGVEAWASENGAGEENVIALSAPQEKEVGASLSFPEESTIFAETLYPLLRGEAQCFECHSEDGTRARQQPFFASSNLEQAYIAAQTRINLNDAASLRDPVVAGAPRPSSRLLVRLRDEGHNCWTDPSGALAPCVYSANEMEDALTAFLNALPPPATIDESLQAVASRAVNLTQDGVIASSGGRFESNVIALYEFRAGAGSTAFDFSGVDPSLNLNLVGDVSWVGSFGLRFNGGIAFGNVDDSAKLFTRLRRTGEYSLEAWVIPANVTQDGPARIVTYSGGVDDRNFTLGQTLYDYDFLSRSSEIDESEFLSTPSADEVLQATLQHVVVNYHSLRGRQIYVNGELVAEDETVAGNLNNWDDIYALSLGGEVGGIDSWAGTIRLLAIHERRLTEEQVVENFEAGVGQKFFLLFGVSHLVDMPEAYVVFEVEVFDDFSYLFSNPFFRSLDTSATPPAGGIHLQGLRIGLNGLEATAGQAFANIDITIDENTYRPEGTPLVLNGSTGTVIASQQGQDIDEFFLTFDVIGDNQFDRPAIPVPSREAVAIVDRRSDFGTRNFGEINATLATVTGVSANEVGVQLVYDAVIQQLPQIEDPTGFLPAHQAGVMQLSVAYCTALVEDNGLRSSVFPGFNFGSAVNDSNVGLVVDPLLSRMNAGLIEINPGIFTQLSNQPSLDSFAERQFIDLDGNPATTDDIELQRDSNGDVVTVDVGGSDELLADLILEIYASSVGSSSTQEATERAVISGCTAAVGSAVMLLQ